MTSAAWTKSILLQITKTRSSSMRSRQRASCSFSFFVNPPCNTTSGTNQHAIRRTSSRREEEKEQEQEQEEKQQQQQNKKQQEEQEEKEEKEETLNK